MLLIYFSTTLTCYNDNNNQIRDSIISTTSMLSQQSSNISKRFLNGIERLTHLQKVRLDSASFEMFNQHTQNDELKHGALLQLSIWKANMANTVALKSETTTPANGSQTRSAASHLSGLDPPAAHVRAALSEQPEMGGNMFVVSATTTTTNGQEDSEEEELSRSRMDTSACTEGQLELKAKVSVNGLQIEGFEIDTQTTTSKP